MQFSIWLRGSLIATVVCLVTACGGNPRTSEQDAILKRVAVLSLLNEEAQILRTGLTVFNNDSATVDLRGRANADAVSVVQIRLRSNRPDWTLVEVQPDRERLLEKLRKRSWNGGVSAITEDLAAIAKAERADSVFVIAPARFEREPIVGLGVWLRSLSGSTPASVAVYATVVVYMVDKNGETIANRTGGDNFVSYARTSELGITYDLSTVNDPSVQSRVSTALLAQLQSALTAAMSYLGYK